MPTKIRTGSATDDPNNQPGVDTAEKPRSRHQQQVERCWGHGSSMFLLGCRQRPELPIPDPKCSVVLPSSPEV